MRRARSRAGSLLVVSLLVAALGAAGCDDPPADAAAERTPAPAAAAGGACRHLDYAAIKAAIGVQFEVAAAAQQGQTETCVVQPSGESYPDLLFTLTTTTIEPKVFSSTVTPKGAAGVPGLGKVAYTAQVPAAGDAGPGVEVAWLSGKATLLMMLRLRVAVADAPSLGETGPKLVTLAQTLEGALG